MFARKLADSFRWLRGKKVAPTRRRRRLQFDVLEDRRVLTTLFSQTNLIADGGAGSATASQTDPDLINPWGITALPGGDFWISDNGTGKSTFAGGAASVVVPPASSNSGHAGTPTGIVANTSSDFNLSGPGSSALFIFDTQDGTISGWNGGAVTVEVNNTSFPNGADYTGLAIGNNGSGNFLYAANFSGRHRSTFLTAAGRRLLSREASPTRIR